MAQDDADLLLEWFRGAQLRSHPQPMYRALRDASPVVRVEGVGVLVNTWRLVDEVLHNPQVYSSAMMAGSLKDERPLIPLHVDPPDHGKFRRILDPLFSPKRVKQLEPSIASRVNELIDDFIEKDEIDFAKEFSVPFPTQVFLTLLGLPIDELPVLLAMKDGIIRPAAVLGKPPDHPDVEAYQAATARSIYTYFDKVFAERSGERRDDLLSWFLDAEIDGHRLSREDILDICFLFMLAGLDTVSASLDCFFSYLAEHAELRRAIVADPSLVPFVVEELLRWESPVMMVSRAATLDTELAGCPIHVGEHVMAMLCSANTDETTSSDAAAVRVDHKVQRHFAFGGGAHHCLGSHLARLELRTALQLWHERIPDYQIKPGVELIFTPGVRSVETFPMILQTLGR